MQEGLLTAEAGGKELGIDPKIVKQAQAEKKRETKTLKMNLVRIYNLMEKYSQKRISKKRMKRNKIHS